MEISVHSLKNVTHSLLATSLFLGSLAGSSAIAAVIGALPDVVIATATDVSLHQTESDVEIKVIDEAQCFELTNDLYMDNAWVPATEYNIISCHILHADPIFGSLLDGKALFDGDILGVISDSVLLDNSDIECGDGMIYPIPGAEPYRGLEGTQPQDRFRIVAGGRGIQIQVDTPAYSDQVRVITCCPGENCDPV
jgi:hypothetical protein